MTTYRPPLHDMQFVLEHICDVRSLAKLEAFASFDPDSIPDILAEAGRFFSEVFAPLNRTGDTTASVRNDDGTVTTPPGSGRPTRPTSTPAGAAPPSIPSSAGAAFPGRSAWPCRR